MAAIPFPFSCTFEIELQDYSDCLEYITQYVLSKKLTDKINGYTGLLIFCEGLIKFFGTSSKEIIERTKREDAEYHLPKIDQLSSQNDNLSFQIDYLRSLLLEHNTPFQLESEPNDC